MDFCSLLVKNEDLCPPATLSSILGVSTSSTSLLVGGIQGGSSPAPRQADDSPLLRSLSPILPLSQTSAGIGQEVSLANVFVPLDAIKPSESQEIGLCVLRISNVQMPLLDTESISHWARFHSMPGCRTTLYKYSFCD